MHVPAKFLRPELGRPSAVLVGAILSALACAADTTSPTAHSRPDGPRGIQILLDGRPAQSVITVGALGPITFTLALEEPSGRLLTVTGRRIVWGSTYPAVAEAYEGPDRGYAVVRKNGRARIIADLDGLRDTVTLDILQTAVAPRVIADTVVALTPDAVDVGGGAARHDTLRFAAVRVDSNGYEVGSVEEIRYNVEGNAPFHVISERNGDTARVVGLRPGRGRLIATLGSRSDTVVVEVADAFRVVRLVQTPSGALRVFPDTARIPPGAAVLFQNEATFATSVGGSTHGLLEWSAGPIPAHGREAQLFTQPDVYPYGWGGAMRMIIVARE